MIWDELPDCILDKIYSKIIYKQCNELLDDIRSYVFIMNFIKSGYTSINNITWYIIFNYENKLNYEEKLNKYDILKCNNTKLNYIKFRMLKLNSYGRYKFVKKFLFVE